MVSRNFLKGNQISPSPESGFGREEMLFVLRNEPSCYLLINFMEMSFYMNEFSPSSNVNYSNEDKKW